MRAEGDCHWISMSYKENKIVDLKSKSSQLALEKCSPLPEVDFPLSFHYNQTTNCHSIILITGFLLKGLLPRNSFLGSLNLCESLTSKATGAHFNSKACLLRSLLQTLGCQAAQTLLGNEVMRAWLAHVKGLSSPLIFFIMFKDEIPFLFLVIKPAFHSKSKQKEEPNRVP